jgi:hypothetical protein
VLVSTGPFVVDSRGCRQNVLRSSDDVYADKSCTIELCASLRKVELAGKKRSRCSDNGNKSIRPSFSSDAQTICYVL